jgi:thiosulfate/3-mercaptopyruvate sulfurtransferase
MNRLPYGQLRNSLELLLNHYMMFCMTQTSPLVSAAWLLENLNAVKLVDVRFALGKPNFGLEAFKAGHLPGAVFLDLERDLSSPVRDDRIGGRHPLPNPEKLAEKLSNLGIGNSSVVVTYDDPSSGQGFYAAHLWWLLRWLGHDGVAVLDGGLPTWLEAGGKLETGETSSLNAVFTPRVRSEMVVDAAQVAARTSSAALLDSRAAPRYRGEIEPLDWKAGHIPGAVNMDWSNGLSANGTFKPVLEQQERFAKFEDSEEVLVYCGSGVSAGANMLALELAGVSNAKLYAGSWSDWVSNSSNPVAVGSEAG